MRFREIFLLTLFFTLVGCQSNENSVVVPVATENTEKDFIQLAWFYKPPEDGTSLVELAQFFDVFILTHYDEEERDELRDLGVNAPFLEYLVFIEIQDPGSCDKEPYGNQVAYKTGDFCKINAEHPDWFLRDKHGEVIRNGKDVFMDPGNAEYREFWLERAKELRENYSWDGVFIDNLEASLNKFEKLGTLPEKYPDDKSFQIEMEGFLAYINEQYFEAEGVMLYANIVEYDGVEIWLRYLSYLDGAMVEDFAVDYNNEYYLDSDWENQLSMISEAQAMGKSLILVSQGEREDLDRERFSLASYLLINNAMASFCYTDSDHYEEVWLYENYSLSLGNPKGAFYEVDEGWRRDFAKGYVFVDPNSHQSKIYIE